MRCDVKGKRNAIGCELRGVGAHRDIESRGLEFRSYASEVTSKIILLVEICFVAINPRSLIRCECSEVA